LNKESKNWVKQNKNEYYFKSSKLEGYRSRAAYKLIEIDKKFKIFQNKKNILDLGASPGSWSQVIKKKFPKSNLLSVDIKPFNKIKDASLLIGDFNNKLVKKNILNFFNSKVDLILSDMAHNTTGNKNLDVINTGELCLESIIFSQNILNDKGILVSKLFMGSIFDEIKINAKEIFKEIKIFKPKSSKSESKEVYIICKDLKNPL
tara:strand:- start:421 stop:1035 length:615 start_codon:yes stop_codon:yes gene_type:complete